MLKLRQTEARQRLREDMERLERIESQLRQIEQEDSMFKYDVVIKSADEVRIASVRDVVPTPPEQGPLWDELEGYLGMHRVKPSGACLTLYHGDEHTNGWDVEVCEPIDVELSGSKRIKVKTLPAVDSMACTIHHGPFATLGEAYNAIGKWISDNGYQIVGPCRELYLQTKGDGNQNDPDTVTEIQFPVEKVAK
jgi:effector-binding domain-containing protein